MRLNGKSRTERNIWANFGASNPNSELVEINTRPACFYPDQPGRSYITVSKDQIVHTLITPEPEKVAKYREHKATDQNNPAYAALVESVDDSVGRLLQSIRALGLEQNTLVIFTSDNGGLTPKNTSNYPLMGGKSFYLKATKDLGEKERVLFESRLEQ